MRWLVGLGLVAGCNGLLGVHEFDGVDAGGDAASPQTATARVTATVISSTATSDVSPTTIAAPIAAVTLVDGTPLTLTQLDGGGVAFQLSAAGTRYRVIYGAGTAVLEEAATDLRYDQVSLGRGDLTFTDPGVELILDSASGQTTGGTYEVSTTGVWAGAVGVLQNNRQRFPWGGQPVVLGSRGDKLYFTHLSSSGGVWALDRSEMFEADITADTSFSFNGSLQAVPQSSCVDVDIDTRIDASRVAAVEQAVGTDALAISAGWALDAMTPGLEHHTTSQLAVGTGPSGGSVHFGNPFPETAPVLVETVVASFTSSTHQISTVLLRFAEATAACGTKTPLRQDVAIPSFATVAGLAGDHDHDVSIDRTRPVAITWTQASPGPVELTRVTLIRVDGTGARSATFSIQTNGTSVLLDPALFEAGKRYAINLGFVAGIPGAAVGDYTKINADYATAITESGLFTITN